MVRPQSQPVCPHLICKCPVAAHRGEGADSRQLLVIHEAIETVTVGLSPAPIVSFAADELLLTVTDAIGPVPVTSNRGVGGVTPLGGGDGRQVGGGGLVADVTGRLQCFVLLPGPMAAVHLPSVPVGVWAVDVVIPLEKSIY